MGWYACVLEVGRRGGKKLSALLRSSQKLWRLSQKWGVVHVRTVTGLRMCVRWGEGGGLIVTLWSNCCVGAVTKMSGVGEVKAEFSNKPQHCLQQAALDTDLQRNDLDGPNQFISVCREIIISFVRDNFPTHKVLRYSAGLLPFFFLYSCDE